MVGLGCLVLVRPNYYLGLLSFTFTFSYPGTYRDVADFVGSARQELSVHVEGLGLELGANSKDGGKEELQLLTSHGLLKEKITSCFSIPFSFYLSRILRWYVS